MPTVILSAAKNHSDFWRCTCPLTFAFVLVLTASVFAQKKPPATPINLNTATIEQLQQLPGIGEVTAKSIFDFRTKSGPFRRVEDILAIRGISEKRFIAIRPYIMVPAAAPKPPVTPAKSATPAKPPATPPKAAAAPPKSPAPSGAAATPRLATAPKPAAAQK